MPRHRRPFTASSQSPSFTRTPGCRSGGRACHRAWLTPGLIWEVADGRRLQARGVNCALL